MSARRLGEFAWHGDHVDQGTIAPYGDLYSAANGILDHPALQLSARPKRRAGNCHEDVTRSQPRSVCRASSNDLRHAQTFPPTQFLDQCWRQWSLTARDPEPGATHSTGGHQGADNALCRFVDRYRQAYTDASNRSIDSDHAAAAVCQYAAAVAGVESRVSLDHFIHHTALPGWQRSTERGNDAGSDAAGKTERVADGDYQLPHLKLAGIAEGYRAGNFASST
jgi:hypothetical protein